MGATMKARLILAAVLVLLPAGCTTIEYAPDSERAVYLAAKDAAYCLWRLEAVTLEDLNRARPHLEATYAVLAAESETELDSTLSEFFAARIDEAADPRDREILKELVAAALDDLKLRDPEIADNRARRTAVVVVGGILDGIAHANTAAKGSS